MKIRLLNFRKTDHFYFRQWDRNIDDQMLCKILPYVECSECVKDVIIAHPTFLRRRGINAKSNECLVVIISHNVLITCYWCNDIDYLYSKDAHAHFQELSK